MSITIKKQNGKIILRDDTDSPLLVEGDAQSTDLPAITFLAGASDAVTGFALDAIPDDWVKAKNITTITAAHIGQGVTTLGTGAFAGCSNLASVTLPDSLTVISDGSYGNGAFGFCTSLTSVTIPNSVTSIGNYAFYDCTSLTSVTIGNSVTTIGVQAFTSCTSLTSITIPNSVTTIGVEAFNSCTSLTSVTIPDSVTNIESYAFYSCSSLTSADILVTKTIIDAATNIFQSTHTDLVLHVRASDATWTAGTGLSIGGNASVDVIKDL